LPDICDEIKGLGINFSSADVEMERGARKFGHDIGTFEPESVEEVAIRGDDDGGIFVREDFNQFWSLGKVFVSRVLGSEEGNARGIRDVCILGAFRGELNE
jgi:hypothetical protein